MHKDFLTALWHNEPLRSVYNRLIDETNRAWNKERGRLYEDYKEAESVLYSLRQPADSFMFKWALSFITEAEKQENEKNPERLIFEARLREAERELLELKEEEVKELKKQAQAQAKQEQAAQTVDN